LSHSDSPGANSLLFLVFGVILSQKDVRFCQILFLDQLR
jgi:hypothetical protein